MVITKTTEAALNAALERANERYAGNLAFRDIRPLNGDRTRFRLTLRVRRSDGPGHRLSIYSPFLNRNQRRLPCACWHAHGYFFEELWKESPNAVIRTGRVVMRRPTGRISMSGPSCSRPIFPKHASADMPVTVRIVNNDPAYGKTNYCPVYQAAYKPTIFRTKDKFFVFSIVAPDKEHSEFGGMTLAHELGHVLTSAYTYLICPPREKFIDELQAWRVAKSLIRPELWDEKKAIYCLKTYQPIDMNVDWSKFKIMPLNKGLNLKGRKRK